MASEKLFDTSFFHRLARLSLSARIHPLSGFSGHYKSKRKGNSIEFSDIREYLPGDDIRRIDWNAYARTEKLFVKLYMDERDMHYHILIDMSRSMDIPKEKSNHTRLIAAMLAWLALKNGDRIDITFLKEQGSYTTKTYSGTACFYHLLTELEQAEFSGICHIKEKIHSLSFHGSGTVFLLSDFLYPWIHTKTEETTNHSLAEITENAHKDMAYILRMLRNKKQSSVLIQIVSRQEESPEILFTQTSSEQLFTLTDSETGKEIKITPSKELLKNYHMTKTMLENQLYATTIQCQSSYLKTISDEPLEKLLESGLKKGIWK